MKSKRKLRSVLIAVISVAIVAAAAFYAWRSTWVEPQDRDAREAFLHGTIGTELVPLPVFALLPEMFPDQFQPGGPGAGNWIQQFGFIPGEPGVNEGLPIGFTIANYLPRTGEPSPVKFVGFSCSVCHTSLIRRSEADSGVLVYGMGSISLDFFGWADAFRTVVLDEQRFTPETLEAAYQAKYGKTFSLVEKFVIRGWVSRLREGLKETLPKYDEPFGGRDLRDSSLMPIGPGRSQAFKSLVQIALDRPGATDRAYSKLPAIYQQGSKERAQFDGSAKDVVLRSALAALGSGTSLESLALPEVLDTLRKAADYSINLNGPRYEEVFKDLPIDRQKADRGRVVYANYCGDCHGWMDSGGRWVTGKRQGEIVLPDEINTDRERISFRYYASIAKAVYDYFPDDHPLNPSGDDLRQEGAIGFLNAPLQSMFTRAPYLHNGSVLTLAELINLKPRREVFYRGSNFFDPLDVGLIAPAAPDARHYYRFDTRDRGNSNKGHDYPWPYRGPGWDEEALKDLLEYLKTQ